MEQPLSIGCRTVDFERFALSVPDRRRLGADVLWLERAVTGDPVCQFVEPGHLICRQLDSKRSGILTNELGMTGSWNGNDVVAPAQHPRQCHL